MELFNPVVHYRILQVCSRIKTNSSQEELMRWSAERWEEARCFVQEVHALQVALLPVATLIGI